MPMADAEKLPASFVHNRYSSSIFRSCDLPHLDRILDLSPRLGALGQLRSPVFERLRAPGTELCSSSSRLIQAKQGPGLI